MHKHKYPIEVVSRHFYPRRTGVNHASRKDRIVGIAEMDLYEATDFTAKDAHTIVVLNAVFPEKLWRTLTIEGRQQVIRVR